MTTTLLLVFSHIGAAMLGLLVGWALAYSGTIRLMLHTLNGMIKERETTGSTAAMMELPGLTLFRSTVRQRRF